MGPCLQLTGIRTRAGGGRQKLFLPASAGASTECLNFQDRFDILLEMRIKPCGSMAP